jgi:hypothetical protein
VLFVAFVVVAGEVISRLGGQLEQAGMLEVFAIPRARMPVVKFKHPDTGGSCRAPPGRGTAAEGARDSHNLAAGNTLQPDGRGWWGVGGGCCVSVCESNHPWC